MALGKVVSCLVISDFTKLLDIEGKIQDLKDLKMLFGSKEPGLCDCCIPKKYRDPNSYDRKME